MKTRKVLVIAAHPDDEVLGCGGAIARHIEEKDAVKVLILGEGITSRKGLSNIAIQKQQKELYGRARNVLAVLGAGEPHLVKLPDNQFDSVPLLSIVHEIEAVLEEFRPDLVYTHHGGDVNIDHRITLEATEAAVRPLPGGYVREVRMFEIPSSSEWNFTRPPFHPNVFVALTESQLKKKIDAMREYTLEIREFPHPRSPEYIGGLARVRGGGSGTKAAEAFELLYARS